MDHFTIPLALNGFTADFKKLSSELKSLKCIVHHYYNNVPARELWKNVLQYRRKELPNLCLLVELVLSIAVSNSFVASTFSFLTAMLSDRRLCFRHETMANLLMIRANHLAWSSAECEQLVNAAVKSFVMRRCKLKVAGTNNACYSRSVTFAHGDEVNQPPIKMSKLDDEFDTISDNNSNESESEETDDSDDSTSTTHQQELDETLMLSLDES